MNSLDLLGWCGCLTGLTGAALLALRWRYSAWGWLFFLVSNICWIAYAYIADASHIELQHIGFMATSLLGVYRWLLTSPRDQALYLPKQNSKGPVA